ncbi:hypothetical protein ACFSVJ_10045 [Prauserella oleivorans]
MTLTAGAARAVPDATDNIITAAELKAGGMSDSAILRRCRPGGPWRRLLPGVILLSPGEPTRRQLLRAVARYLGPDTVITGIDALSAHGLELPRQPAVHVLVRAQRRVLAPEFVQLERTIRVPDPVRIDGLPYAPARGRHWMRRAGSATPPCCATCCHCRSTTGFVPTRN